MNLPGWLFSSAILTFSFQTVEVTFGSMNAFTGGLACKLEQVREDLVLLGRAVRILHDQRLRLGQLAHVADPGVLASLVTPTYSEWSVTPMKSIGVSILMS